MGAVKAYAAQTIASAVNPLHHLVGLDQAIRAMWETGRDMSAKYKETSQGDSPSAWSNADENPSCSSSKRSVPGLFAVAVAPCPGNAVAIAPVECPSVICAHGGQCPLFDNNDASVSEKVRTVVTKIKSLAEAGHRIVVTPQAGCRHAALEPCPSVGG